MSTVRKTNREIIDEALVRVRKNQRRYDRLQDKLDLLASDPKLRRYFAYREKQRDAGSLIEADRGLISHIITVNGLPK